MEDTQNTPAIDNNVDIAAAILNTDLETVDRSRPLLASGVYDVTISAMEVRESKTPGKHNLNITLKLDNGAQGSDGRPISPGFTLFDLVSLTKTDKYNPAERLADIQLAVFGEQRPGFKPIDFVNQKAQVQVKIEPAKDGFPEKNRIARWLKKKPASGL